MTDNSYSDSSDSETDRDRSASFATNVVTNRGGCSTGIKRIINASASLQELPSNNLLSTANAARRKKAEAAVLDHVDKPKRKVYKKNNKGSWQNIFAQCKAVVSISRVKSDDSPLPGMTIHFCDSDFLSTFGYVDNGSGLPFSNMMGRASSVNTLSKIENCLRSGRTCTEYINLYRSDCTTALSCHVSLLPLKSHEGSSIGSGSEDVVWGVLTVRSASAVGNARFSGFSFLGIDKVSDEIQQEYYISKIMKGVGGGDTGAVGIGLSDGTGTIASITTKMKLASRKI